MEPGGRDPELLKRANGEVKIGNKNKIAPAGPGCLDRKHGTYRPPCPARQAGSAPGPSQTRNVSPSLQLPPRRASQRNLKNPVQIPALPPTSRVTLGKELSPPHPQRVQAHLPGTEKGTACKGPGPPPTPLHHVLPQVCSPLPGPRRLTRPTAPGGQSESESTS